MSIIYDTKDNIQVQLGDKVTTRIFLFFKYTGVVAYVPGISPKRRDMEHNGILNICIKCDDRSYITKYVDEGKMRVHKSVKFIERGEPIAGIQPDDIISEDDEFRHEANKNNPPMPGIRPVKTTEPHVSKLGGCPNLPENIDWPVNPKGVELDLLAQIHCPELPPDLGFPTSGTIFVFYDCKVMPCGSGEEDREYWKIVYTEEPLPDTPRPRTAPRKNYKDSEETFVSFDVFESRASDVFDFGDECGQHQMLGYPLFIQENEIPPGKVLLLQIDTDTDLSPDWMWGDAGRIFFWISSKDLSNGQFDKAEVEWECG